MFKHDLPIPHCPPKAWDSLHSPKLHAYKPRMTQYSLFSFDMQLPTPCELESVAHLAFFLRLIPRKFKVAMSAFLMRCMASAHALATVLLGAF